MASNTGLIKPVLQLGPLWEGKPAKMNQPIYYFNNMSKRTWKRVNVPENIEEENECCKEVDNQIETNKKILDLMKQCGFEIGQVNGQRKLGPPPNWTGPPPEPQCEVFVGKIPRDLYEDEIFPVFVKIGQIYEIRLMMDFSGNNRGYCFVMYAKPEYAKRAIAELNNYEIRPGHRIGVVASINNCRLCVSHLPPNLNVEAFIKKMYEITDNVAKVSVYRYQDGRIKNAMILYTTHIGAAMARRRLVPDRTNFFEGTELAVDWACPNVNFQNVIEESGIMDEKGQIQITKNYLNASTNRKSRRNSYRSESSNGDGSSSLRDKEAFENKGEDSGQCSKNSMRSNFSGRQKREKFVHYRNPPNKQRTMSESDLRKGKPNFPLRPISKQSMPPKMKGSHTSLNNIHKSNMNKNAGNDRSNLDLSKTSFDRQKYPETINTLNGVFVNQENNQNTAMKYQPMYVSNSAISASLFNNNRIGSSSMMNLNAQTALRDGLNRDKYSVENILPLFHKYLNLEPGPNYAGNGLLNSMFYNGLNHNCGLMPNGNNLIDLTTNGNSYVQPNFSSPNCNVGQQNNFEKMNNMVHFEVPNNLSSFINHNQMPNFYQAVVNNGQYYNAIPMPSDSGVSFNDNCYENNQNFLNNVNGMEPFYNFCSNENTQRITLNSMGVTCLPKYDTKAFGLGKMQPNFHQQRQLRPILNRNLSENVK